MTNNLFLLYFVFLNILIFFQFKNLAKILNIYDLPDERKLHKNKTPLLGGLILVINLILFSILFFLKKYDAGIFFDNLSYSNYLIFLFATFEIFLLGLFDDKYNLNPNLKLFFLIVVISLTLLFDNSLIIENLIFSFTDLNIFLSKYSFAFTLLCFLLYMNACNMYDGINLQTASYNLILLFYFMVIGITDGFLNFLIIFLILIFILNKNGKIFMGDSGVYSISFIMGYIVIKIYNFENILTSDLIFILMMVPGIDMFRLFILRILNKKNPFAPDRNHIHHLLLNRFSYIQTLIILNFLIIYPLMLSVIGIQKQIIILIYVINYVFLIFFLKKQKFKNDS